MSVTNYLSLPYQQLRFIKSNGTFNLLFYDIFTDMLRRQKLSIIYIYTMLYAFFFLLVQTSPLGFLYDQLSGPGDQILPTLKTTNQHHSI